MFALSVDTVLAGWASWAVVVYWESGGVWLEVPISVLSCMPLLVSLLTAAAVR